MSLVYGFQYVFHGQRQTVFFQIASVPFLLGLVWLTWEGTANWDTDVLRGDPNPWWGFAVTGVTFVLTTFFYSDRIAALPWYIVAASTVAIAALCGRRWAARGITVAYALCGLALYVYLVATVRHTQGANMLEIIEAASATLANGENPYKSYEGIAKFPFAYLPGLWLPYALLFHFGIEVRVFNLVALVALVLLFESCARDSGRGPRMLAVSFYPIMLSPPVAQMVMHGHVWPYWLLLTTMAWLLHRKRHLAAGIVFGLMLATRQPALFLAGPLAIYALRRLGVAGAAKVGLASLAAAILIYAPFAAWAGRQFWDATFLNLLSIDPEMFLLHLSGRSLLYALGLEGLAKYVQALATLAAMVIIARRRGDVPVPFLLLCEGLLYAWLVAFSPYAFRYEYLPAFLLIAFALAAVPAAIRTMPASRVPAPTVEPRKMASDFPEGTSMPTPSRY